MKQVELHRQCRLCIVHRNAARVPWMIAVQPVVVPMDNELHVLLSTEHRAWSTPRGTPCCQVALIRAFHIQGMPDQAWHLCGLPARPRRLHRVPAQAGRLCPWPAQTMPPAQGMGRRWLRCTPGGGLHGPVRGDRVAGAVRNGNGCKVAGNRGAGPPPVQVAGGGRALHMHTRVAHGQVNKNLEVWP